MEGSFPMDARKWWEEPNTSPGKMLGVKSAKLQSAGHPVDGQHVSGNAVIYFMGLGITDHLVESVFHHVEKPFVHFALAPEKTLPVLHPLEITDRHSPSVAQNIRHRKDSLGIYDGIGLPGGRSVSALAQNFGLHTMRIFFGDLIFNGRGNGYFARLEQYIASSHFCATARKILQRLFLDVHPLDHFGNVKTI